MTEHSLATGGPRLAPPATMRAMVQERYGRGADVLRMRSVAVPPIGPDEVLVKVRYSSVNALEWHLMNGKPYVFRASFGFRPKNPTLGADLSGVVVAVGDDVAGFAAGDEVFGEIWVGAYAEYAKAKAEHLALLPSGVVAENAAALGVAALTALQGLRDAAGVGPGSEVLINGASGGVGTYAIQIAKALGGRVTAVCSTRNVEMARSLGADRVIDYTVDDFTAVAGRYDVVFDIPGNRPLRACKRLLRPGGTYVLVGGPKGDWTGPLFRMVGARLRFMFGGKRFVTFTAASRHGDLVELGALLAGGEIRAVIEDIVPLDAVGAALDRQGEFHARGKTVVAVEGSL